MRQKLFKPYLVGCALAAVVFLVAAFAYQGFTFDPD